MLFTSKETVTASPTTMPFAGWRVTADGAKSGMAVCITMFFLVTLLYSLDSRTTLVESTCTEIS